ncbi:MAG: ergothioneine biosynthesis protein EgtB [Pseudomonadota bacterium]
MELSVAEVPVATLSKRLCQVRAQTESLVSTLSEADAQLQSMPDVSPAKWHLAHTSWFFETFILCEYRNDYRRFNDVYNYLFNSYYNGIGEQYPRHQRGLISRPSLSEVMGYRQHITKALCQLLESQADNPAINTLVELGIHHEQQHQELLLTDIKHCLFHNPSYPAFMPNTSAYPYSEQALEWLDIEEGLHNIGYSGNGFAFDNEQPRHPVYLAKARIASRLVTNGEYLAFINDKGYQNPEFWLADGWAWLQTQVSLGSQSTLQSTLQSTPQPTLAPLYWVYQQDQWFEYTLHGLRPLDMHQPLVHVNYYEASAYANWLGLRLPTEYEWEAVVQQQSLSTPTADGQMHPNQLSPQSAWFATAWQWTTSAYSAYPGFTPFSGVAGEYNGKFMSNQYVLRGSSCVTSQHHARSSYRNFFYAHQAWQFTGIRLAK